MSESDSVFDALQRHVDELHTGVDRAGLPPAGLWKSIRAQAIPEPEEKETYSMDNSVTFASVSLAPAAAIPPVREGVRHHLSMAATLALVLTVALGGWFATMQLSQPPAEPRPAVLGIQPEDAGNGVCDVESLTVDEAIQIVQNPMFYVYGGEENARADGWGAILDQGHGSNFVGAPQRDWTQLTRLTPHAALPVSEEEFAAAFALSEEYRDCLQTGTRGQVWALFDPVVVQYEIATRIPLLQPLEETRIIIDQLLAEPTIASTTAAVNDRTWRVNPNDDLAVRVDHGITFHTFRSIILPIQILDRDGEIVASYDIYGNRLPDGRFGSGDAANIVVTYSRTTESWYVAGSYETSRYHDVDNVD